MQHDLLAASKIIQEVVQGKNIEKLFNQYIGKNHNISLVKDIVYGSIRDIYLNEYFLNKLISVELKNLDIKYLLLNAFYQLSNQSIKSFTIVNENVKAAKLINNKFSGLVNGVLRNFVRKRTLLLLSIHLDLDIIYSMGFFIILLSAPMELMDIFLMVE